jgi:hypothetical protein
LLGVLFSKCIECKVGEGLFGLIFSGCWNAGHNVLHVKHVHPEFLPLNLLPARSLFTKTCNFFDAAIAAQIQKFLIENAPLGLHSMQGGSCAETQPPRPMENPLSPREGQAGRHGPIAAVAQLLAKRFKASSCPQYSIHYSESAAVAFPAHLYLVLILYALRIVSKRGFSSDWIPPPNAL